MFIKGNLEVGGNIAFKDTNNNNISVDASKLFYSLAPVGIIACFYSSTMIPQSWAICDGQTIEGFRTPNLSGKFIKGASTMANNGETNEAYFNTHKTKDGKIILKNENMPIHSHTITNDGSHNHTINSNSAGSHKHSFTVNGGSVASDSVTNNYVLSATQGTTTNIQTDIEVNQHSHSVTISSDGDHTHTLDEHGSSSPEPIDIMPPYYTLVYIIKYK
jgi:microcystin-dependent protein